MEDYADLRRKGIQVDGDNDPAPENISQTNNTTTIADKEFIWTGTEGIVCPRL